MKSNSIPISFESYIQEFRVLVNHYPQPVKHNRELQRFGKLTLAEPKNEIAERGINSLSLAFKSAKPLRTH